MNAPFSKTVLLAAATNDKIIEVFIERCYHEHWVFRDNTIGPYTSEGGTFRTINLKGFTGLSDAEQICDTVAEAEQRLTALIEYEGYRPVTEAEAQDLITNCPQDPLPEPPAGMVPGTLAYSAWLFAQTGLMTGDEADEWKDRMKDGYDGW
jgi:hypothetical protein